MKSEAEDMQIQFSKNNYFLETVRSSSKKIPKKENTIVQALTKKLTL